MKAESGDLLSWLLREFMPAPVVHGDGRVSHYEPLGRGWVPRADRLTVLPRRTDGCSAFEALVPSAIQGLLRDLASHGWLWVRESLDGPNWSESYLAHPASPEAQRAKTHTTVGEFMSDLGHAAVGLAEAWPVISEWAAKPPAMLDDGTIRYWSWIGLAMNEHALFVPLGELCELAPPTRDRLLKQMRRDGWTRTPMGNAMVHPSASVRTEIAAGGVPSSVPAALN